MDNDQKHKRLNRTLFNQTKEDRIHKFSRESSSSKPQTALILRTKKQTNHSADVSWVLPDGWTWTKERENVPIRTKHYIISVFRKREKETRMARACRAPRQSLQNHPSGHLGWWAKLMSAGEMLCGQSQRMAVPG